MNEQKNKCIFIGNDNVNIDLIPNNQYETIEDPTLTKEMLRVVDESGEDYIYPKRFFKLIHNSVFEMAKDHTTIREIFNFKEALGDTISEKNESLYVKIFEISKQLQEDIKYIVCSKYWWENSWSYFSAFKHYESPQKGNRVARFHDQYDIYLSEQFADECWVMVNFLHTTAIIKIDFT